MSQKRYGNNCHKDRVDTIKHETMRGARMSKVRSRHARQWGTRLGARAEM